jgi:chromosome partitioning protein
MNKKPQLAPVVAVLNMKGGVGKTTVSAHVIRVLYLRHKVSTLLIDLDPQFNLSQTVLTRAQYEGLKKDGKTVLSIMEPPPIESLFQIKKDLGPPPTAAEVMTRLKHVPSTGLHLSMVAGDFGLTKYSLIPDSAVLTPVRKRFLDFIEACRSEFGLVVIDCNPSSSFITLCALRACTHLLVPVRPDRYSILGLELLSSFVEGFPDLPQKPKMTVLLNGVPTQGYDPSVENALRSHKVFGPITIANNLYVSKMLQAHPDFAGFATDKKVPHSARLKVRIEAITDELSKAFGLP